MLSTTGWIHAAEEPAFRTKFDREIVPGTPTLVSTRVQAGPQIDGEVDKDPVWQTCGRTHSAWTQLARKDVSGRQTVVYSCFDREQLYFGFVCEEPELQSLRMDGAVNGTGPTRPGADDCVEAVLELGGLQGEGEVYSFRANARAQAASWGFTAIPQEGYCPVWKSAGKHGPNRWMVEMAIPFSALRRKAEQKGLATPTRGDVIGVKLVRWGAEQQDPNNRMVSTWNTQIAFPLVYVLGGNGLLYFEDLSGLRDGSLSLPEAESPWKREGTIQPLPEGGLSLATGARLSQTMAVRPGSFYCLAIQGAGALAAEVDGKELVLTSGQAGFWSGEKQERATLGLRAVNASTLKRVSVEYHPGEEPAGPFCLTNNYRHTERNLRAILPAAPDGSYRYVGLDYKHNVVAEDHPRVGKLCHARESWAQDVNTIVEDPGGTAGWIPFSKGGLTGKPEVVLWNCLIVPEPKFTWGIHNHAVEIDLGAEYFVSGLDVLCAGPYYKTFEVWGKLRAEDEWTYLHTNNGQFVEPAKRQNERRGFGRVRGLNSVARYLRWCFTLKGYGRWEGDGYRGSVCVDGLQEFWVWGQPKGQHAGIKSFQPWFPNQGVKPVKWTTTAPDPDACQIVPRPRRMEKQAGWFVIGPGTRIVPQDQPVARKIAAQIQQEIRERWQLEVPIAEEPAQADVRIEDAIYLGQPNLSAPAERMRQEEGLTIEPEPQAYALRVSSRGMIALGRDGDGLYWAAQSLMLAMRWHNSKDPKHNGLGVRCLKIEDWPATQDRSLLYLENSPLSYVQSEIPRLLRNCQLQTRLKWNAAYSLLYAPELAWPPGRLAQIAHSVQEQHHMELRPRLLGHPRIEISGWDWLLKAPHDRHLVETDPDEMQAELASGLNLCPLERQTYETVFARLDTLLAQFGRPSKIWLGGLALHDPAKGSRWAVCRTCQKSGKSQEELYAFFVGRVAEHLRQRKVRGVLEPWNIAFGDRDAPRWRQTVVVADVRKLPQDIEVILPEVKTPAFLEFIKANLQPAQTASGPLDWPAAERFVVESGWDTDLVTASHMRASPFWAGLVTAVEPMWRGAEAPPKEPIDFQDLQVWGNSWHFRRDFPAWRAGERPTFFPLDLRPFANHAGHPTGKEMLEAGRVPPIDLRYLPPGRQVLSGVEFEIIDPAANEEKSVLMLGRPLSNSTHSKDAASVAEAAGPIPVGRKVASLAFLRAGWQAGMQRLDCNEAHWLFPTCRVIYDDDTWLAVDCFRAFDEHDFWNDYTLKEVLLYRRGWTGNCPGGSEVNLIVEEWVNPYPAKVVKCLEFFTPAFAGSDGRKRPNPQCQAFVAITAVDPIAQDFSYWAKRGDRPPLLPPLKTPAHPGTALQRCGQLNRTHEGKFTSRLKGPACELASSVELITGSFWSGDRTGYSLAPDDSGGASYNTEYKPFGVVQTLEPATRLCRVEVRGPTPGFYYAYALGRNHRVDVTVALSEDGQTWRQVGELKGLSGDADFLPLEFEPALVKKIRITATAEPYHEDYAPGMANRDAGPDYPHFVWRLIAPAKADK